MPPQATNQREWQEYIAAMHQVLDRLQTACANEELLDVEAPALPTTMPPAALSTAVRAVQQRMEAVLPTAEGRRDELAHTVRRLSTTRRPAALQDHRVMLGRALDCLG